MNVSFEQIGHLSVTLPADTCKAGQVCKVGSAGKAVACTAGDRFCGLTETVRGGFAGVQVHGFITVPYTGTAPATGYAKLVANGTGGVKVDATNGYSYLTVAVNSTASTVTICL